MFRRIGHVLLIVALLGATGGHWVVLQSFAWANMLADHARTECLADAVSNTFDGKHPCPLCKQIAAERNSEKKADWQAGTSRLEFSHETIAVNLVAPSDFSLLARQNERAPMLSRTPPVPPPRSLQG